MANFWRFVLPFLLSSIIQTAISSECPSNFVRNGDTCYHLSNHVHGSKDIQQYCKQITLNQGSPVTFSSREELNFIQENLLKNQIGWADGAHEHEVIACERDVMNLNCSPGKNIAIVSGFYGRDKPYRQLCQLRNSWGQAIFNYDTSNCINIDSATTIYKNKCNDRTSCRVYANNANFGDPCPGTHKFGRVYYKCMNFTASDNPSLYDSIRFANYDSNDKYRALCKMDATLTPCDAGSYSSTGYEPNCQVCPSGSTTLEPAQNKCINIVGNQQMVLPSQNAPFQYLIYLTTDGGIVPNDGVLVGWRTVTKRLSEVELGVFREKEPVTGKKTGLIYTYINSTKLEIPSDGGHIIMLDGSQQFQVSANDKIGVILMKGQKFPGRKTKCPPSGGRNEFALSKKPLKINDNVTFLDKKAKKCIKFTVQALVMPA